MKTITFFSAVALASTAMAQPFGYGHNHHARHHHHARRNAPVVEKRAMVTDWVTEWVTETVTEYYDMIETQVVNTAVTKPAQFFEGSSTSTPVVVAAKPTTSSPAQQAPIPTPSSAKPEVATPSPSPAPSPAAVSIPNVVEPVVKVPTTTSQAPVVVVASTPIPAPVASTPAALTPAASSASSDTAYSSGGGSSSSSSSVSGTAYTGEVTHYTVGLGACGFDDTGKDQTDYIVAISKDLMPGSNGDPICGKKVNLSFSGKSITATVRDKCPSCSSSQIDLSEKAFKDLVGDLGIGRQGSVKWTVSS